MRIEYTISGGQIEAFLAVLGSHRGCLVPSGTHEVEIAGSGMFSGRVVIHYSVEVPDEYGQSFKTTLDVMEIGRSSLTSDEDEVGA